MSSHSGHVVAIMGATATGKSEAALELAEAFDGEIVSMDSRQVYRGFDIGTAKPSPQERQRVTHHLIDILEPSDVNSAGRHLRLVHRAVEDICSSDKRPFLVGGTGLYFRVFFEGLIDTAVPEEELYAIRRGLEAKSTTALYDELLSVDPARGKELSTNDRFRITRALEVYLSTGKTHTQHLAEQRRGRSEATAGDLRIVLTMPRRKLRERIADRTQHMYAQGWVQEVRELLDRGYTLETPAMNSLGYAAIAEAVVSGHDPAATCARVVTLTQQYAKRQETFFRGIADAHWIDMSEDGAVDNIKRLVKTWGIL
jgi:tRNA dimethylallyltransferase